MDADFPPNMLTDIEQFLIEDIRREPGKDLYEEVFRHPTFFPLQRRGEMAAMIRIARSVSPQIVMEIGADKGGGLYHWVKCLPTVKTVIACEIRGLPYLPAFAFAFPNVLFQGIPQSSRPVSDNLISPIDVLFIDGDKLGFVKDFDAYLPYMNPYGVVFLHDVTDTHKGGPGEAFATLIRRGYRNDIIVNHDDTNDALRREIMGIPPANPHEGWLRHWRGKSCGVGVIYLDGKGGGNSDHFYKAMARK